MPRKGIGFTLSGRKNTNVNIINAMSKMKVACCWDDGVINDLRLTELLRKYHAKATFNLNPGLMKEGERIDCSWVPKGYMGWSHNGFLSGKLSLKDLTEVYDGFQLASHCWCHENADTLAPQEWIKCAVDARKYLEDLVQRPCRGFAWPCGVTTPEAAAELRKAGFAYGRTTRNADDITKCSDVMCLPSNCHYLNPNFYRIYEAARKTGVFYFWGHSYEMYEYDALWQQLENRLQYIAEDPEAEWVDVVDVAALCDGK